MSFKMYINSTYVLKVNITLMFHLQLQQDRAGLDYRQHFVSLETTEHWDRLLRKAKIPITQGVREQSNICGKHLCRVVSPWDRRSNFCRSGVESVAGELGERNVLMRFNKRKCRVLHLVRKIPKYHHSLEADLPKSREGPGSPAG